MAFGPVIFCLINHLSVGVKSTDLLILGQLISRWAEENTYRSNCDQFINIYMITSKTTLMDLLD